MNEGGGKSLKLALSLREQVENTVCPFQQRSIMNIGYIFVLDLEFRSVFQMNESKHVNRSEKIKVCLEADFPKGKMAIISYILRT